MSWRAGMHGNEPVTCRSNRVDRADEAVEVWRVELVAAVCAEHVPVERIEEDDGDVLGPGVRLGSVVHAPSLTKTLRLGDSDR